MAEHLITVLGHPSDTVAYASQPGYNVAPASHTPEQRRAWVAEAVARGDDFFCASTEFTGMYVREIRWLADEAQKLRMRALALRARALSIQDAIDGGWKRKMETDS